MRRMKRRMKEEGGRRRNGVFGWLTVFGRLGEVFSLSLRGQTADTPLRHAQTHTHIHTPSLKGVFKRKGQRAFKMSYALDSLSA